MTAPGLDGMALVELGPGNFAVRASGRTVLSGFLSREAAAEWVQGLYVTAMRQNLTKAMAALSDAMAGLPKSDPEAKH